MNNNENIELVAILGAIGGLLSIITGFLLKLHCSRSNCNICKFCTFDIACDKEEVEELKRFRTIKKNNNLENINISEV